MLLVEGGGTSLFFFSSDVQKKLFCLASFF